MLTYWFSSSSRPLFLGIDSRQGRVFPDPFLRRQTKPINKGGLAIEIGKQRASVDIIAKQNPTKFRTERFRNYDSVLSLQAQRLLRIGLHSEESGLGRNPGIDMMGQTSLRGRD